LRVGSSYLAIEKNLRSTERSGYFGRSWFLERVFGHFLEQGVMDMSSPLVSIITPTYNHERFIGPCIDSVLRQTYANWEQIIIDDGSTDKTAEVVQRYSDPRILYVHQANQGIEALAHTYNHALSVARGDFVAILEGDDLWPPDKLASLIPHFADDDIVLAFGGVAEVSADGTWSGRLSRSVRRRRSLPKPILFNDPVGSATRYMLRADGADFVPASTAVMRRSALESAGGFQYFRDLCVTDFPTFISLTLKGRFHYTPHVMGYRRRHRGSATYENQYQISSGAHNYAKCFIEQHQLALAPKEAQSIEKTWHESRCDSEFTLGRLCLMDQRWQQGRLHFQAAITPSLPRLFLAASIGWILSWLHCDFEPLLAMAGYATLREDAICSFSRHPRS
jgi:hypothetical protein